MTGERFEYPLPILSVDTDRLQIETKDRFEGGFKIRNAGGSVLSGRILSRTRSIVFEPETWEGNEVAVTYRFTPSAADGWKPGDVLDTCAVISSNGGEQKLPVFVKLTKMAVYTDEGVTIANIRDFYEYAAAYPAQARRLFTDGEFYMLLLATGFPYMEAYETLHKDLNRDRAIDNFFLLSGLKQKTTLTLPNKTLSFTRNPGDTAMIYGNFLVQKSDRGYFEAPITTLRNVSWLSLSAERLIMSDFNDADAAMVKFAIDPLRVKGRYASESIIIGNEPDPNGNNVVSLSFKRLNPLSARLNREAFRFEDKGVVEIINHTGADLLIELFCEDAYVRLPAKKFFIADRYEIPFDIKPSAFLSAQLLFRKTPFLRTAIEIKAVYRDAAIRRRLPLTVGAW